MIDDKTLDKMVRKLKDIVKCESCRNHVPVEHIEAAITAITALRERIAALEGERYALKDELRQANGVRDVFASAVVAQAMQEVDKMPNPQESPVDKSTGLQGPDPNGVICPQCVTQFHAVPVNVQARIAALRRVVAAADAMRRYDSYRMPGEPHWQYDVARAAIKEGKP